MILMNNHQQIKNSISYVSNRVIDYTIKLFSEIGNNSLFFTRREQVNVRLWSQCVDNEKNILKWNEWI